MHPRLDWNYDLMSGENSSTYSELEERLRFETLIADLSSRFVNLPAEDVDKEILEAQRGICECLDLDVVGLWQWSDEDGGSFLLSHLFSTDEGLRRPERANATEYFPWSQLQMLAGRTVVLSSIEEFPAEAAVDRETFRHFGIKSSLTIPLSTGGKPPFGALAFNSTRVERVWPPRLVKRLQLAAEILANALARKRSLKALQESEGRLAEAAEVAALGFSEIDFERPSCFIDERFQEICGLPAGPHSDLRCLQLWIDHLHPDDRQLVLDERQKLIQGKFHQLSLEYRYLHPAGKLKWIHHLARVVRRSATGQALCIFGVIRDITQNKLIERETQELRNSLVHLTRVSTLGELSGSLAHELNQPLGIILSNAQAAQELLAPQPPDVAEVQAILSDIVAAERRAEQVIARLRALFRRGELSRQPLHLNQVIEEILQLSRTDLLRRGVTVVQELGEGLPPVSGDRVHLQQLILNLVLNAADAMAANAPGTRRLTVTTVLRQRWVEASVKDEGHGLPPDLDRLFQPFYTTKPEGLGLGLSICRSIVAAHGGRLWAEPHVERGAAFHFELPIAGLQDKA
jgi:PAS domain S-box-containing protein